MYKLCCYETRCPSSDTEFSQSAPFIKACSAAVSFPHSPPSRRWVYTSEPTNLNLYRRSRHFTCPLFLSRFGAVKPSLPFLRSLSRSVDLGFSWSAFAFQFLFR
jgi:hypothetical protein